jgi:hypothetical protein
MLDVYVRRHLLNHAPPHARLDITVLLERVVKLLLSFALRGTIVLAAL